MLIVYPSREDSSLCLEPRTLGIVEARFRVWLFPSPRLKNALLTVGCDVSRPLSLVVYFSVVI